MKNRNLDHKDDWATPDEFYNKLNEEFNFDFDPCPFQHDLTLWNGLEIEWGDIYYINIIKWNNLNVQNVENLNQLNFSQKEPIENVDIARNVKNVNQQEIVKNVEIKQENDIYHLKNMNFYPIICQDAQDVILLNHLMKLIFLKTREKKQDLAPIVKYVKENFLNLLCEKEELTPLMGKLLNNIETNIDIVIKDEKDIENDLLLEIKNIEQKHLNGLIPIGIDVNYFLEINVPIVNVKNFLLKTILYQYLMIIVQEPSPETLFLPVQNVTHQKEKIYHMIGVLQNLLNESISTSNIWMKLNNKSKVFINPPYSRDLKEKFINKAVEESKKGKLCVMLLPVSTSTKIFHEVVLPNKKDIRFIKGRLKFKGINTFGEFVSDKAGMHDSMIVIFDGR